MQEPDESYAPDRKYGSFESSIGDVTNSQVVVGKDNVVGDRNIVAHIGAAAAGPRGAAATEQSAAATGQSAAASEESAIGTGGSTVAAGPSSATAGLVARARKSRVTKVFGLIAILATAAAIGLLAWGVTDLGVAGFIVTVIALIVSIVPLFSNK